MRCPYCGKDPRHGAECRQCGAPVEWDLAPRRAPRAGEEPESIIALVKRVMEIYMPVLEDRVVERLERKG